MNKDNNNINQQDFKRRKSAKIPFFPQNIFSKNVSTSEKTSSAQSTLSPPLTFKSNSLFAYQEIDKFSSFCDNETFPLDILSYLNDNQTQNNNNQNSNTNNQSTKHEEYEQSEESDSSNDSKNDEISEDEIVFKKYEHRMEKRKSALNSVPLYVKNFSSFKPKELTNNKNNIFDGNKNKINPNALMNNNYLNNNNYMLNNNNNNFRRNSFQINQFQNSLLFNNILNNSQNNSFNQFMYQQKTNKSNMNNNINNNILNNNINNVITNQNNNINNINNSINNSLNNNYIQNNNNAINSNSSNQLSFVQRYPNNNNSGNFNNFNYINNFGFNFFNNNIQNTKSKKRNSMLLAHAPEVQVQRRSSHTSIPSIQMMNFDKKIKKINIEKEENPKYFLKDQLYCRQIQNKLDKNINNLKYSEEFYENIKYQLVEIIEHQFGNYVIQKFLSVLLYQENKQLFKLIFLEIDDKLFEICIHNFGTRVIQKTLEKLDNGNYYKIETNELNEVLKKLIENHLYELCCDKNGNHVFQKILRVFPKERNQFLFDSLIKISFPVSIIQQGATLLQVAFDYSNKKQQEDLCTAIIEKIEDLINDKYGNYTIQTIFKLYIDKINDKIYEYIDKNIVKLSKEKFSSNVIDKCIIKEYDKSKKLVENILQKKVIKEIIVDQYGNYVVQKILNVSEGETITRIINQIKPILGDLKKTNIGKKVYEKLIQNYKEFFI